ncbi:glycosyltransferase [Chitinispirillales bacterium ANBcel5]|uniref:CgeB family protein n=1 Tax=Cellulosispirillum alkaliphilum TaxID=3039283 RepID=UPI002A54E458|nr:glycosyltransferase [Chitinispirillales bacterium ANBcel5]
MTVVIFGLAISSSWGNGHATLWRGIIKELLKRNHEVIFYERDVPYYASHRDYIPPKGLQLVLYSTWKEVEYRVKKSLKRADAAIITSYCKNSQDAYNVIFNSDVKTKIFYDLDTPVTLNQIIDGEWPEYIPSEKLSSFDLVLSYTGGDSVDGLKRLLGAKRVDTLYGCVDPDWHKPVEPHPDYISDLSYLGTYALDRHGGFKELFLRVSEEFPGGRFLAGGAQYPEDFEWKANISFAGHVPPPLHNVFYSSSKFTLNITRKEMVKCGYCPSARIFEAAACRVPVISDSWSGIENFFEPISEILIAKSFMDVIEMLQMDQAQRDKIAKCAQERVFDQHRAYHRAQKLENLIVSIQQKECV